MSVIVGLRKRRYVMENIGELGPFILEKMEFQILQLDEIQDRDTR